MVARLIAVVVTLAVSSCATVERSWTVKEDGVRTAALDLRCQESELQVNVLTPREGQGCRASKIGVRGCGQQTTYECDAVDGWYRSAPISSLSQ